MIKLDILQPDLVVAGLLPGQVVTILSVRRLGGDAVQVIYKSGQGALGERMLFRSDEKDLELATADRPWSFAASGADFRLGTEALRISLAHLFDPMMAIHTSNVDPYPHQLAAVYQAMLPRQPLRFVLADDPGAGKTIMAGLFIRELLMRDDVRRVLIVSPGSLSTQWQDEMQDKFGIRFEIFSREKQEQCASGNFFQENNLLIVRLDQVSRSEDLLEKLKVTEWDLVIVDEAHKLAASLFGREVKKTRRYKFGEILRDRTRHFLLMTATPHNGKEQDFQLFMALLDEDRFGRTESTVQRADVSDLMRRMVKEDLLKFDGTKLFPERRAYTVNYDLSDSELDLYEEVTSYVRHEMNQADKIADPKRKGTVGFALTMLQRRLASSPEAIFQSLKRRRQRLEERLKEEKERKIAPGRGPAETYSMGKVAIQADLVDDPDDLEDESTGDEYEEMTETLVDEATAAKTIAELEAEIVRLGQLVAQAKEVVNSRQDRKWDELSGLLQDTPEMFKAPGVRRKLIIFTEHRDTLNYLVARLRDLLSRPEAVVAIHGGTNRDERQAIQESFRFDPSVLVLVATDAAGEGVNLQNANLMVNYDLPWNPNRLEQRFGRIHRIGQTEVCHLWNLVANQTREGEVFSTLLEKLETERMALGGRVFDILGNAFDNVSLKDLLVEAIRYGELPEVRAKMTQVISKVLDTDHLREVMRRNALVEQHMDAADLYAVREEMERAEARRLQPYFIRSFFADAFRHLGGTLKDREQGRFEISHVPSAIREHDRKIGQLRQPVQQKYERICFEKKEVQVHGRPMAALVHPGHPLMRAVSDMILCDCRDKLQQGAVMVDPADDGVEPRLLFLLDHVVRENRTGGSVVSRQLQFVTSDRHGVSCNAGWAPHLDLEPMKAADQARIAPILQESWIANDIEATALAHAAQHLAPAHFATVSQRRNLQVDKTQAAVRERLVRETHYWWGRYVELEAECQQGRQPRMQPEMARQKAEEFKARLDSRLAELDAMRSLASSTPVVLGCALVIPQGLLSSLKGDSQFCADATERARVERMAMQAVIDSERARGHTVFDISAEKCGWDITSRPPPDANGRLLPDLHIEVKGRAKGQDSITVTKNEILCALNQRDKFILAIVLVDGDGYEGPFYVREPFEKEPDPGVISLNYGLDELLTKASVL